MTTYLSNGDFIEIDDEGSSDYDSTDAALVGLRFMISGNIILRMVKVEHADTCVIPEQVSCGKRYVSCGCGLYGVKGSWG